MLIVSDDFTGLSSATSALFPDTDHQLCLVHMQRNLRRNMSKGDVKAFHEELEVIKRMNDYEKALSRFEELCRRFEKKYPKLLYCSLPNASISILYIPHGSDKT